MKVAKLFDSSALSYALDLKIISNLTTDLISKEHIVYTGDSRKEFASYCRYRRASRSFSSVLFKRENTTLPDRSFLSNSGPIFYCLDQPLPNY
jgi:hypothetical protein